MKKLMLIFLLFIGNIATADTEYEVKLNEYLEASGANDAQRVMLRQMFAQFKKMFPENPYFQDIEAKMNKELGALNKKLVPVYQKHISIDDLKECIKFYKTPAAQRIVKSQPAIITESMQIGMAWGEELSKKAMSRK